MIRLGFVDLVCLQDTQRRRKETAMRSTMECVCLAHGRHGFGSGAACAH